MRDYSFIIIIAIGSLINIAYFVVKRKKCHLSEFVLNLVSSGGICAGFKVMRLSITLTLDTYDKLYVFIGGAAVIWVSIQSIIAVFKKNIIQVQNRSNIKKKEINR